jgi:hypothetical protein
MTTITVDGSSENTEVLNSEEQDSLAVGEQLEQEQNSLLAGKYKDAQELESAYIELQKKLGENTVNETEPEFEQEFPEENTEQASFLDQLWEESMSEYNQETLDKLRGMDPAELANMYLDYRKEVQEQAPVQTLSNEEVQQLKGVVGGEENYQQLLYWASQTLSEQEINMFDHVMDTGDTNACYFAIASLAQRYKDSVGYEGQMLTGKASTSSQQQFQSQAELVQAMSDPRYDKDPAYRKNVMDKLANSNIDF